MSDTTFEKAKRCPRCEKPGEVISIHSAERDSKVHILECRTEGCQWHKTTWVVQVMRDGSIPERQPGEKQFPPIPEYQHQHGRDLLRQHKEDEQRGEIDFKSRFRVT